MNSAESRARRPPELRTAPPAYARKRILLTGCNSLLGHQLFQQMRNDDVLIKSGTEEKPHQFLGTLVKRDEGIVPAPSASAITLLDMIGKPKTFTKGVLTADTLVVDLMSGTDPAEAETIIKILRQPLHETPGSKQQTLVVVSSVLAWNNTPAADATQFCDADFQKRVPTPKFQYLKNLENLALTASKINLKLKVHVLCAGLPYGNGEANDVFYEFFRRAWLSAHPELAALPVIGAGANSMPTIHVTDLARCVRALADPAAPLAKQYLVAVDRCAQRRQSEIMKSISSCLGNGALKQVTLSQVIHEDWAELMSLDLNIKGSPELDLPEWHCAGGITQETMPQLNEEFNHFRGLFPLKVFIGGPPLAGKSHFASQLASGYGIPHLRVADMIEEAQTLEDEFGRELREKIEELKDVEMANYEKNRKKKDPDLDRAALKPRLPDELVTRVVQAKTGSPACMNKGFILDGYPRSSADAKQVFMCPDPAKAAPPLEEGAEGEEPEPALVVNQRIAPQFVVVLEAEDAFLQQRAKELPAEARAPNQLEPRALQRLKTFREANGTQADEKHLLGFFRGLIGEHACMLKLAQAGADEARDLEEMQALLEQNGKPCCVNLITARDSKFLEDLKKPRAQTPASGAAESDKEPLEVSEEERARAEAEAAEAALRAAEDEVDVRIREEEEARLVEERAQAEKQAKEEKAAKDRATKEAVARAKLEKVKEQERKLLDTRSQPIRQYLMDNVVPHLTEGLIEVCKKVPDDSIDYLANFLLERADQLDEKLIKQREEEIRAKEELKRRL